MAVCVWWFRLTVCFTVWLRCEFGELVCYFLVLLVAWCGSIGGYFVCYRGFGGLLVVFGLGVV